jgi:hypothetical protein
MTGDKRGLAAVLERYLADKHCEEFAEDAALRILQGNG